MVNGNGANAPDTLELETDVLVIGGGPAATWAALTARQHGVRVVLVDKGFCGSSGVTAAATAGCWWLPPDRREDALCHRDALGKNMSDRSWLEAMLDETYRRWPEIGDELGYPAAGGLAGRGSPVSRGMEIQGPVYMREMRRRVSHSGARILDHAPALELLVDADGAVCGAAGVQRQKGRRWCVLASAVIIATGGCCWHSGALGANVCTGDGHLMAAEVGATLSGMEFCNYYGVAPVGCSLDKSGVYSAATFTDADGNVLAQGFSQPGGIGGPNTWLLEAGLHGPVYAQFDLAPQDAWWLMRAKTPNLWTAFDRQGIDPFHQRFEIDFVLEGLTRGTGGLHAADVSCFTGVPGLWAAGDALSRQEIAGAASGAGAANAAFTIASGSWSGRAAAEHALSVGRPAGRPTWKPAGRVGLRPSGQRLPDGSWRELNGAMQAEVLPPEKNGYRSGPRMARSLEVLDGLWRAAAEGLGATGDAREQVWARESAAMLASARWSYRSAQQRTESRGMHQRTDFTESDPRQRRRVLLEGVDEPVVAFAAIGDPVVPYESVGAR